MPGNSPAIFQGCGIILPVSCSGWLGSAFFLSHQLPAEVVCVSPVVQVSGPLSSQPSLPKVADFLLWLRRSRKLSVSSIMGYGSMLATVFHFKLPNMSFDPVLHDLVRSFRIEAPFGRHGISLRCSSFLTRPFLNRATGLLFVT